MPEAGRRYYLVVTQPGGPFRQVVEAFGTATAGREPANTVFLAHPLVSRRHAEISPAEEGRFTVRDLQSRNGTKVNGQPLSGEVTVGEPVVIEIGPFVITVATNVSDETWTAAEGARTFVPRAMLDRSTRQFHVNGSVALDVLSAHEYALLDLLAARAPAVVERSAAGDAVWGMGQWDVYMLHNLVSRLRKRIAQKAAGEVIVTVPGVGYRLA